MKTARLIVRFLHVKAAAVRRQCLGDCLMSLGISIALLLFQFAFYSFVIWVCTCGQVGAALLGVFALALVPIVLQFIAYSVYGNFYRDPRSALEVSPEDRLFFAGFFLVGPQTFAEAFKALRKAGRVSSADFDNCANVLYALMKEHDRITIGQVRDAVSIRQSVIVVLDQLRLFPGVIVRPAEVRLTPGLRVEIAEFCRREKERIYESVAVDEAEDW
jgi:hypothetical protein